ncbi:MAG: 50S ribosomal protein L29 [Thermoplasmata archaeon]
MTELRAKEIRQLNKEDLAKKLDELRAELLHERGISSMGGAPYNPGKIKSLRRQIARIETITREEKK